jgi:hypothetical protein
MEGKGMILEREKDCIRAYRKRRPIDPLRGAKPVSAWLKVLLLALLAATAACNTGTGSTTSSGATGSGGTGVGWTVDLKAYSGTVSLSKGETTTIIATVKDAAGGYAPKGTRICMSTTHGLIWIDELGKDTPVIAGCVTSSNDRGQLMGTYVPLKVGTDQVQATSQGAFGSTTIQVGD